MIRKTLILACIILLAVKIYTGWHLINKDLVPWAIVNVTVLIQVVAVIALFFRIPWLLNMLIPFIIYFGCGGLLIAPWTKPMLINQGINVTLVLSALYIIFRRFRRLEILRLVVGAMIGVILLVPLWLIRNGYLQKHPQYKKHIIL